MTIKKKHIIVVEDEPTLVKVLQDALEAGDYKVTVQLEGEHAVEVIEKHMPDMVILDLMLPGKTGTFILEELRFGEKTKNLPVLVLSNISEVEDIEDRVLNEPNKTSYLLKSNVTMEQIVAKVNQQLDTE